MAKETLADKRLFRFQMIAYGFYVFCFIVSVGFVIVYILL